MNEELLKRKSDPKYDEDLVNLKYLKEILDSILPIGIIITSTSSPKYGKWKSLSSDRWQRIL